MSVPSILRNRILTAILLTSLAGPLLLRAADAPAPAVDPARLADILGDTNAWTLTPATAAVTMDGETPVLAAAPGQAVSLVGTASHGVPTEYVLVCRLRPAKGASASANLQVACATLPDKTQQALGISLSGAEGTQLLSYNTSLQHAQPIQLPGSLALQAVKDRSLAWSEELRRSIEAQMARAPRLEESTFTMRCTVEPGRFRTYLDGRFLNEIALPKGMDPAGTMKLQLYYGAELVSIRARPLPPVNPRFEPIRIDGLVNAAEVARRVVDHASLPAAPVNGVPFVFAAPRASGEDHLDLGPSWVRFGALPGYFAANFGTFGGRWISANRVDPCRFAMYVPPGRYKALHLVAVADGGRDAVPVVTAQFYRPNAGHPFNFSGRVPDLSGRDRGDARPVTVKTTKGRKIQLYHVVIPLDPDAFSWFSDLKRISLELTKAVRYYRGYPDPLEYSWHGAGLPSSVRIYAATLERAGVEIDIQPAQFGHVWTAPAKPSYTIELRNDTGVATTAKLVIETKSENGQDTTRQQQQVTLPAGAAPVKVPVALGPTRYGLHELTVSLTAGKEQATYRRKLAYLHPDTRERGNWEHGRGSIFGYWGWGGGHDTPKADKELTVMGAAGAETSTANYSKSAPEIRALAEKLKFISEAAFEGGSMYVSGFHHPIWNAPKFDPAKPQESAQAMVEVLKKIKCEPSPISRPVYLPFFAEPYMGPITVGVWPSYYGEDYQLSADEQAKFDDMLAKYVAGARLVRKTWPDVKLLMPYGDPMNAALFLRLAPETRELIDGCALDLPGFERTPEQQVNQVVLNRMYPIMKDIRQYVKDPYYVLIEGTCISSKDLDTGEQGQAEIGIRDFLVLMGYGVTQLESGNAPFDCANYWGENHYGGGWCNRLPLATPKPAYVQYATLTRHVNRANFNKYVPTGSTSVYCQQYKHYKTGKLIHVLWTIRGKRPVTVQVPAGATLELFDPNDNVTALKEKNGTVTFAVDTLPVYLEGLTADAVITLGERSPRCPAGPGDRQTRQPGRQIVETGGEDGRGVHQQQEAPDRAVPG